MLIAISNDFLGQAADVVFARVQTVFVGEYVGQTCFICVFDAKFGRSYVRVLICKNVQCLGGSENRNKYEYDEISGKHIPA